MRGQPKTADDELLYALAGPGRRPILRTLSVVISMRSLTR